MARKGPNAFTLIELLVVVAIIALLISILLPSLKCAREQARAAKCGVMLRGLGIGLSGYAAENSGWIPGVNTTGYNLLSALASAGAGQVAVLRKPGLPVQTWDWISPIVKYDTEMGDTRAKRFQQILNRYSCPNMAGVTSIPFGTALDDADFDNLNESTTAVSYLMPAMFQTWGQENRRALGMDRNNQPILARVFPENFEVVVDRYESRIEQLGPPARKIAAADGARYYNHQEGYLDHEVVPQAVWFGAFTSAGGWWCGDESYGVRGGSRNWDGQTVNGGSGNPSSQGRSLALTYRHGCPDGSVPQDVQSNKGSINALFFDGHVGRMNDRQSREITYWYPTGGRVNAANQGLTRVPNDFVIP